MKKRKTLKTKKIIVLLIVSIVLASILPAPLSFVFADDDDSYSERVDDLVDSFDFEILDEALGKYLEDFEYGGQSFVSLLKEYLKSDKSELTDTGNFFGYIAKIFSSEFKGLLSVFVSVFAIAVLSGLLRSVGLKNGAMSETAGLICSTVASALIFGETATIALSVLGFVSEIIGTMEAATPVFVTLSALSGGVSKNNALTPVCSFAIQGVNVVVSKILFPAVGVTCAVTAIAPLADGDAAGEIRDTIADAFKWFVGISVSLLSLITAISGISGSVKDGISMRALKYAVGNAIPVIGGFAKEGVDVVLVASQAVKSGVGALFTLILLLSFMKPVLRILCFSLGLKLLGVAAAPVAEKSFSSLLSGFSKVVDMLAILLVAILILFFFLTYSLLLFQA